MKSKLKSLKYKRVLTPDEWKHEVDRWVVGWDRVQEKIRGCAHEEVEIHDDGKVPDCSDIDLSFLPPTYIEADVKYPFAVKREFENIFSLGSHMSICVKCREISVNQDD